MSFGKQLAHTEKKVRDGAVNALSEYLKATEDMSELEYLKLWKGLFYCFWMSDKPLIQQELAEKLSKLICDLKVEVAFGYLSAFWKIIVKEWYGIDRLRLDKYYMLLRKFHFYTFIWIANNKWSAEILDKVLEILQSGPLSIDKANVPESLRYHTIQVFFEEFTKAVADLEDNKPKKNVVVKLLEPFLEFLKSSANPVAIDSVLTNIFDSYHSVDGKSTLILDEKICISNYIDSEQVALQLYKLPSDETIAYKNRKQIAHYLGKWGDQVGIPFVHSKTVTGRTIEKVKVPFDEKSVKDAKKRKHDPSDDWEIVQKEEVAEYDENANAGPEKKKKKNDSSPLKSTKSEGSPKKEKTKKAEPIPVGNQKKQVAAELPVSGVEFYSKPTQKTPESSPSKTVTPEGKKQKKKKLQSEKDFNKLEAQLAKAVEAEPEAVDSPSQSEDKKSVRWGPRQIKPFFKSSLICNPEEAKTSPKTGSPAPKVLKKTNSPIIIAKRTVPARTSPRKKAVDFM
ncbi:Ribosomal RNA processing protein 1 B [Boothiomyces sp. JEL0866]|nr:Ribosomal RNA processing protein 1 B [Boothiomyces sp. JEL0866]KAJ3319472.1 Ribosomal RNA processing protein 1 B [Boothiomyces sp. JEL0866]